jgi:nucleoside-diphosphate-sugar epimerase
MPRQTPPEERSLRVFLTGATGYMGGVLLDRLLAEGIAVLALARPHRRGTLPARSGLEWVLGGLDDAPTLAKSARETDATIHVAAQHDAAMERLDRAAVTAIADGLRGSGKPFIMTSATPVYGDTGPTPRDEREPVDHPHPLRAFRLQHDRFVVALNREDVRAAVVRPPFVYGRAGGVLVTLIGQARRDGVAYTVGDGRNRWSTVHVDDLADLYLRVLRDASARGVYNAAGEDTVSLREIAEAIAAAFGPGIAVGSWSIEQATARLGDLYALMALEQRVSSGRARAELGWAPRASTLLDDLTAGSYWSQPLAAYSH